MAFDLNLPPLTQPNWLLRYAQQAVAGFYSYRGVGGFGGRVGVGINLGGTPLPPITLPPVSTPPISPVDGPAPAGTISPDVFYYPERLPQSRPAGPRRRGRKLSAKERWKRCVAKAEGDSDLEACDAELREALDDADETVFPETPLPNRDTSGGRVISAEAVLPVLVGASRVLVGAGSILGPIIAGGLFWPTGTARDDVLLGVPATRPAGPRRRGRRRPVTPPPGTVPRPTAPPRPVVRPRSSGPVTISTPRTQAPAVIRTGEIQAPRPGSLPTTVEIQVPASGGARPGTGTIASPTAAPAIPAAAVPYPSRVAQWASNLLPFLPLALPALGALSSPSLAPRTQAGTYPLTGAQPNALTSPSVAALPQSDSCSKARTRQRKRRKKPCTNPTVSSRVETKGSKRYQITKRWLKCPASSRKKRRSRPVASRITSFPGRRSNTPALPVW